MNYQGERPQLAASLATSRAGDTLVVKLGAPAQVRRHARVHHRVSRQGAGRSRTDVHHQRRSGTPPRPDLEPGRGPRQSLLVPDVRLSQRQDDLGARSPRCPRTISRSPTAAWCPTSVVGANRTMTWNQATPSATYLVSLDRRTARADSRHLARAFRSTTTSTTQDSARAWRALPRHARHDRRVFTADRRQVSVGQVRPDHGRRFLRRHGERQRDDAGRLAPRRARRTGIGRGISTS